MANHNEPVTTPESPTAKRHKTLDTRISGTETADVHATPAPIDGAPLFAADDDPAAIRTDQGHRQLDPGASAIELAVSFRQMAFESATLAATCLEERKRTNVALERIQAQLTLRETPVHVHHLPPLYRTFAVAVIVLSVAQVVQMAMHFLHVW